MVGARFRRGLGLGLVRVGRGLGRRVRLDLLGVFIVRHVRFDGRYSGHEDCGLWDCYLVNRGYSCSM